MGNSKKYAFRVVQDASGWSAEILRRVTSKTILISKSRGGFATEAEAQTWGSTELQSFVQNQNARNKRRVRQRA